MHGRGKSGFTLIELLVVVGIIALLVAILLPSLKRARELGLELVCANNIRELGKAELGYVADNRDFSPWRRTIGYGASHYTDPWGIEQSLLFTYLGESKNVFLCPMFEPLVTETPYFSYSMNWNLGIWSGEDGDQNSEQIESLARVRAPSRMVVFCEENPWGNSPYATHGLNDGQMCAPDWPYRDSFGTFHRPSRNRYEDGDPFGYVGESDNDLNTGVTHGAFLDGHVEWVTALQTERLTLNDPSRIRYPENP